MKKSKKHLKEMSITMLVLIVLTVILIYVPAMYTTLRDWLVQLFTFGILLGSLIAIGIQYYRKVGIESISGKGFGILFLLYAFYISSWSYILCKTLNEAGCWGSPFVGIIPSLVLTGATLFVYWVKQKVKTKGEKHKVFKTILLIFAFIAVMDIFIFGMGLIGSIGHDFYPWGDKIAFYEEDVTITPPNDCLGVRNSLAQAQYDLVSFYGCSRNSQYFGNYGYYPLIYENGSIILNMKNMTIIANESNNYTLTFFADFRNYTLELPPETSEYTSVVNIKLHIEDGTKDNIKGLLVFLSPVIIFILILVAYLLTIKKIDLNVVKKLRKISFYTLLCLIILFALAFKISIFLLIVMLLSFLLLPLFLIALSTLIVTQLILFFKEK